MKAPSKLRGNNFLRQFNAESTFLRVLTILRERKSSQICGKGNSGKSLKKWKGNGNGKCKIKRGKGGKGKYGNTRSREG